MNITRRKLYEANRLKENENKEFKKVKRESFKKRRQKDTICKLHTTKLRTICDRNHL